MRQNDRNGTASETGQDFSSARITPRSGLVGSPFFVFSGFAVLCFGPLLIAASTACSKRAQPSSPLFSNDLGLTMKLTFAVTEPVIDLPDNLLREIGETTILFANLEWRLTRFA